MIKLFATLVALSAVVAVDAEPAVDAYTAVDAVAALPDMLISYVVPLFNPALVVSMLDLRLDTVESVSVFSCFISASIDSKAAFICLSLLFVTVIICYLPYILFAETCTVVSCV